MLATMELNTRIRIHRGFLLEKYFDLSAEGVDKVVLQYRRAWRKQEHFIIPKLEEITGLTCNQKFIDAYVVDAKRKGAISSPMIIGAGTSPADIVVVLAHEFTHRLTMDNTKGVDWHISIQKMYLHEPVLVANHVMIHAILEATFSKKVIDRDIRYCNKWPAYKRAWEIVKRDGYKNIIENLKQKSNS